MEGGCYSSLGMQGVVLTLDAPFGQENRSLVDPVETPVR